MNMEVEHHGHTLADFHTTRRFPQFPPSVVFDPLKLLLTDLVVSLFHFPAARLQSRAQQQRRQLSRLELLLGPLPSPWVPRILG